ncbi:MAG: MoaD/ThiS family protein [Candidatus Bathyarchaeia archaeon]
MRVKVKFVGGLRSLVGQSEIQLKLEREMASLSEAINKMVEELPELKKAIIDSELGDPRPNALIIVNGKEIGVLNGLETVLRDGAEIVFLTVSHGG